jgi:heme o synthase
MDVAKRYYWLTKPGIVFSNTIAAMAGFFLASGLTGQLNLILFLALVLGIVFVIGAACVLNNYIDRDIDRKMKRTSWRATATGKITKKAVYIFASVLGVIGFGVLALFTNILTIGLVVLAFFSYVVVYGAAKRKTIHSTLIGTVPGAIPPVAGYVAVTGAFDVAALLIFLIMVCWQMPHFYAIGMRRRDDYAAAKIPVMPVVKGMRATKIQILFYVSGFILFNILLVAFGYVGYVYLVVMSGLGIVWLVKGMRGFKVDDDQKWAKRMFSFSLVVLLSLCGMWAVGGLLP